MIIVRYSGEDAEKVHELLRKKNLQGAASIFNMSQEDIVYEEYTEDDETFPGVDPFLTACVTIGLIDDFRIILENIDPMDAHPF